MIATNLTQKHKADLRVFGAIGFQDMWLRKHGYDKSSLFELLAVNSVDDGINIIGLTSEDDKMLPGFSEDRFGFLKTRIPSQYGVDETERGVIKVGRGGRDHHSLYIINCETRHPNPEKEQNWKGLKLHVIGGNMLPKQLDLKEAIKDANDRGYMTFLMGVSNEMAQELADTVISSVTGVISHDANNTFPDFIARHIPQIRGHSRAKNKLAIEYAESREKPSIAVSSAHYVHEIGIAGIEFQSREFSLQNLRTIIENRDFTNVKGHNKPWDVLRFGYLLGKHGSKPDRFKGTQSSYN